MLTCTGRAFPTPWQTRLSHFRFRLRERLTSHLSVSVDDFSLQFVCHSPMEEMRVRSLLVKEEGTIEWLRKSIQPGDVMLDVGANIGLYGLVAARLLGKTGHVYAIEPHAVNVISLMQNIAANELQDRISVIGTALHSSSGMFDFNYYSLEPGSAMSQLNETRDGYEQPFVPVMKELKLAVSIDDLIERQGMRPPHHVKIDVDGNELQVLEGMLRLLQSDHRPRSVQVEVNRRYRDELFALLGREDYRESHSHYTANGKAALASGCNPDEIPYNAVFEPRS